MAFFAGNILVFSDQGVSRLPLVIKFGILPTHIVVARATLFVGKFFGKKVHVVFFVTLFARRAETKKVNVILAGFFVRPFVGMALGASDLGVSTVEIKTRLTVVEFFLVYVGCVMIPALMIVMAGDTGAFGQPVKGASLLNRLLDLNVTGETFTVRNPLPCVVAFETVAVLQVFMTSHQWARR